MNIWTIAAIIVGLLIVTGVVTLAVTNTATAQQPEKIGCSSCQGKCTADSNCGQASCQAANGRSCGCGKS